MILVLLLIGGSAVADLNSVPNWLGLKLMLFALVIACGLALRFVLIRFYSVWHVIEELSYDAQCEMRLRRIYWGATGILVVLWSCIAGIVVLSIWTP